MLPELGRLFLGPEEDLSKEKARRLVMIDNILNKSTFENRRVIWNRLNHRYFKACPEWIVPGLVKAAGAGLSSADFISLSFLYYVLRDRVTYDFIMSTVWNRWSLGLTNINTSDYVEFLNSNLEIAPGLKTWRETTRKGLAKNTLAALRDFGLLTGAAIKHIQRPTISTETTYHLLAILWAEGNRGRAILEARDWKLFLWNEADVTNALVRLAQLGWVKFERGGQTVILEMIRLPEIFNRDKKDERDKEKAPFCSSDPLHPATVGSPCKNPESSHVE